MDRSWRGAWNGAGRSGAGRGEAGAGQRNGERGTGQERGEERAERGTRTASADLGFTRSNLERWSDTGGDEEKRERNLDVRMGTLQERHEGK